MYYYYYYFHSLDLAKIVSRRLVQKNDLGEIPLKRKKRKEKKKKRECFINKFIFMKENDARRFTLGQ